MQTVGMNLLHRWLCRSARWKSTVEHYIVPWVLEGVDIGQKALEVGPGPGITTDVLRTRVSSLTCVELDKAFADSLRHRTSGQNVTVMQGDATAMSFSDGSFDTVFSFTMLHHVSSVALQDRLLAEVARVLRPGGVFVGTDSLYSRLFGLMHLFDKMVVVDPNTFPERLRRAGFINIGVDVNQYAFRFRAHAPVVPAPKQV
jgi:SAM-dependent methyltransferase